MPGLLHIKEGVMKKRIRLAGFCRFILAVLLGISLAQAQFIPFHAKLERVQQIFGPDGNLEAEQIINDDYMRNSIGSSYTEGVVGNSLTGQMEKSVKVIENARDGRIYLIDEGKKTVVITLNPIGKKQFQPPAGGKTKTYLGRTCTVLSNGQEPGEIWIDRELGYPVHERREVSLAGNKKMVRISRVTEIMVNQEPDEKLFMVPSFTGYKVIDNTR